MSVERQNSYLSQERLEVRDFRSLESSICADFDVASGAIQAGGQPLVVTGFTISVTGTSGNPASSLVLNTAGGVALHPGASEAGTVVQVPLTQAAEQLSATNPVVTGSFSAGIKNYVGIDLIRSNDAASADLTKFLDANTDKEVSLTVPKARTLNYKIYISQQPFSVSSNLLPIAIVLTDSSNNVSTITDARNMFFRLGIGGDIPNAQAPYTWPDASRKENPITYNPMVSTADPFAGGDKGISSLKSVLAAIQSSLWELRGGDAWYSPNNRDNVQLLYTSSVLSNGDNFSFSGSTLKWQGLKVAFENSVVTYNVIQDNATTGVTILDQQCLYVDIQRDTVATLVPGVANLTTLGTPVIPGTRFIIAWREGADVFTRNKAYQTNRVFPVATTTNLGIVQFRVASMTPLVPIALSDGERDVASGVVGLNANKQASITATSGTALTVSGSAGTVVSIAATGSTVAAAISVVGIGDGGRFVGGDQSGGSGQVGVRGVGGNSTQTSGHGGVGLNATGGDNTTTGSTGGSGVFSRGGTGVDLSHHGLSFEGIGAIDISGSDATRPSTDAIGPGIFNIHNNCRGWANIVTNPLVSPPAFGGNVASVSLFTNFGVRITFASGFTSATSYVTLVQITNTTASYFYRMSQASGTVDIFPRTSADAAIDLTATTLNIGVVFFGV